MRIEELPANWMEPGSDGFALLAGVGCQVLILIPCSRCGHTGVRNGARCVECFDSAAPGYHTMRAPLGQLLDALLAERLKPGALVAPTAVQRTLSGALTDRQVSILLRGICPVCGAPVRETGQSAAIGTIHRCSGACGATFDVFDLADEFTVAFRIPLDAGPVHGIDGPGPSDA